VLELSILCVVVALAMAFLVYALHSPSAPKRPDDVQLELSRLQQQLEAYRQRHKRYPTAHEGFSKLLNEKAGPEPWLEELPKDPWGNEYTYMFPGRFNVGRFDLCSAGPDGINNNEDDICNYDVGRRLAKKKSQSRPQAFWGKRVGSEG